MNKDTDMIYSPTEHIPLGKPVKLPGGGHALCVKYKKRNGKAVTETVPLDQLHELVAAGLSVPRE